MSGHGKIAAISILVCTAPRVVNAHRIIGSDRPIKEGPLGLVVILFAQELKGLRALPEIEDRSFEARKIDFRGNLVEARLHSEKIRA